MCCCNSYGRKETDTTERLKRTELKRLNMDSAEFKLVQGQPVTRSKEVLENMFISQPAFIPD